MEKKKTKRWLKVILIFIFVIAVILSTIVTILFSRIITIASVEQIDSDYYKITYKHDYHLDNALNSGLKTEQDLLDFVSKEFFFNQPIQGNFEKYGCAAFITKTPDGNYLGGRNYDFGDTETVTIFTDPSDGYASYATAALDIISVGEPNDIPSMSLMSYGQNCNACNTVYMCRRYE